MTMPNNSRTHEPERLFKCPTCGKRLSRSGALVSHMRTHTGERPHACPSCPRRFYLRSSLIAHRKQQH
jgi:uncharacterized Zn-finger protein